MFLGLGVLYGLDYWRWIPFDYFFFLSGIVFLWSIRLRELIPGWFRLRERLHSHPNI